jgi:putative ABC transport system substrate-binding protein
MAFFLLVSTLLLLFVSPQPAFAQKVYRISALTADDQFLPSFDGFKKKMAELGYREGENVSYDLLNAKGDLYALQNVAQKLVQDSPDIIVTTSTSATGHVAKLTRGTNLPVVFLSASNPLELVKSYASSGNNLTGISTAALDLTAKRMELLKGLAPWVKRVVSLNNPQGVNYRDHLMAVREAAKKMGVTIKEVNISNREDLVRETATITRKVADAVLLQPDSIITKNIEIITQQSLKEKLPMIPTLIVNVKRGGLATWAPDYFALGEQGAVIADKILKGARPTDLPIEQPDKLHLVINLNTAKAIGVKIPREFLVRADEMIQ